MAQKVLRFLSGVVGHDTGKINTRCAKCGQVHGTRQPSAAVLAGAVVAETAAPAPPDLGAVLRARPSAERKPQGQTIVQPPPPPIEPLVTREPLGATVPSPSWDDAFAHRKFKR